jgi:fumarylacetoacetase
MTTIVPPSVPSATLDHQFSLQNLPYGIFSTADIKPTVGVAIGDFVIHLAAIQDLLLNEVEVSLHYKTGTRKR